MHTKITVMYRRLCTMHVHVHNNGILRPSRRRVDWLC